MPCSLTHWSDKTRSACRRNVLTQTAVGDLSATAPHGKPLHACPCVASHLYRCVVPSAFVSASVGSTHMSSSSCRTTAASQIVPVRSWSMSSFPEALGTSQLCFDEGEMRVSQSTSDKILGTAALIAGACRCVQRLGAWKETSRKRRTL